MNPLYLAATASFIAGMCGYIMVRMWFVPIGRYRKAKNRLAAEIGILEEMIVQKGAGSRFRKQMAAVRAGAMRLLDVHRYELPYWYRLVLVRRQESPEKAFTEIMKLEKCSVTDCGAHLQAARTCLRI